MKFSLVIPTVKQTTLVRECINSIRKYEFGTDDYEIIIVDDGSTENIQSWLKSMAQREPNTRVIAKPENKGFAHTVNVGMREANGEYILLVNNDIVFIKPVLKYFEKTFVDMPNVGIVGAKLLFPPGRKVQHAGVVRIPGNASFAHINKNVDRGAVAVNKSQYFPSVTGALYAIRREAWDDVGDWNEGYFLSCEDTEYSLRAWKSGWHVFYNHLIEAIHIEGHTRGNNDKAKKNKDINWFIKERQTISKFQEDFKKFDIPAIEKNVQLLNSGQKAESPVSAESPVDIPSVAKLDFSHLPDKKLEVGCGDYPQPGYIHLDIRKFGHVDVVCDFGNEKLPFEDGEISEILSNHSIEHVSWRKLPHVLSEWYRVLKPGGKVFFRTPDLEFICKTYLDGKTTPEHANDEGFVKDNLCHKVTPAWWANIKLFAGQSYPGNFHYFALDFEMAKELLERFGFDRVEKLDIEPKFSPGELQVVAYKPDQGKVVREKLVEKVLVKRKGAMGDVILTTPIVRRIKELNPNASVDVATDSGAVYKLNPYVNKILPGSASDLGYDKVIDLDLCYENSPQRHVIESYAEKAFGSETDFDKSTDLHYSDGDRDYVGRVLAESGVNPSRYVVVHMAVTWKNRTWPIEKWKQAVEEIASCGFSVVIVGHHSDFTLSGHNIHDLTKKLTIHQVAAMCEGAHCFVSNDSGLLHVAGTTGVRIVGIFTSAKGEYRVPFRNGEYGNNCSILKPKVECYGCLHKERPPVVFAGCKRNDFKCLGEIDPKQVAGAVIW